VADWREKALQSGHACTNCSLWPVSVRKSDLEPTARRGDESRTQADTRCSASHRRGDRDGRVKPSDPRSLAAWAVYPASETFLNRELCRLLVYLKSPTVIEKTMPLLQSGHVIGRPAVLSVHASLSQRRLDAGAAEGRAFEALNLAEKMTGASTFFKAISDTRSELAAALKPDEAVQLAAIIHPPKPATLSPHALPGHTFKNWKLEDLEPLLAKMDAKTRSRESARDALVRTQCVFCHRVSTDATLPAGVFGPIWCLVSARFGRKDLLDHILNPSKFIDEKFRLVTVQTSDGKTHSAAASKAKMMSVSC
jgi:hypothetical protein